jgi:hypothetical protein
MSTENFARESGRRSVWFDTVGNSPLAPMCADSRFDSPKSLQPPIFFRPGDEKQVPEAPELWTNIGMDWGGQPRLPQLRRHVRKW